MLLCIASYVQTFGKEYPRSFRTGGWFQVIDISNPAAPRLAGASFHESASRALGIAIAGNHAYVGARRTNGLHVLDLTQPAAPRWVSALSAGDHLYALALAGNYAYLAEGSNGLTVVDISNPAAPRRVGGYDTGGSAQAIALAGDYAYVADGAAGVQVIDISDPASPRLVCGYDTAGAAYGVAVAGNHVYVADGEAGLAILELGPPPPRLNLRLQDSGRILSWPDWATGWQPYSTHDLAPAPQWQPVPGAPVQSNGLMHLLLPNDDWPQQFFRLENR